MEKRERWEEIAYKLGSYDCTNTSTGFDPCYEMVRAESLPEPWVPGHYVETKPACQRIASIEAERDRMAVDAVDLTRLRRGLCEIIVDNLDGVDALLYAVAAMRDDVDVRVERVGAERDRMREALREISTRPGLFTDQYQDIAAAALNEPPPSQ